MFFVSGLYQITNIEFFYIGSPPLTGTGSLKIIVQDINDHSPEFKRQSYYATIKENSPIGTWVLTPVASDKDVGLNAKIRYSLLGDKIEGNIKKR